MTMSGERGDDLRIVSRLEHPSDELAADKEKRPLRVDLTRLPCGRRMTGYCAIRLVST
jgi:hypothetical protein